MKHCTETFIRGTEPSWLRLQDDFDGVERLVEHANRNAAQCACNEIRYTTRTPCSGYYCLFTIG